MSDQEIKFLKYEDAVHLVGAIQEEEDIDRENHRILTVYSTDDRELCWFDFQEVLAEVGAVPKADLKAAVQNYILNHIPEWVKEG